MPHRINDSVENKVFLKDINISPIKEERSCSPKRQKDNSLIINSRQKNKPAKDSFNALF